jgi:hypothetical protein
LPTCPESHRSTLRVKWIKSSTAPTETDWTSASDVYTFSGVTLTGGQFGYAAERA